LTHYEEKRRHPRAAVINLYVRWGLTRECEYDGDQVTSLSLGGCFLVTERRAESGETVFIRLWEAQQPGGLYEGVVRYQLQLSDPLPPIGLGVEFVRMDEEDREKLRGVMEYYSKPASPSSP
jgi:hypothetical protein